MSADIRLQVTFKDHRKRKKLAARLGNDGVVALIDLLLTAAEQCPSDGVFAGYTDLDLELDANWRGEPGAFAAAAEEADWVERVDGGYRICNWVENQPWLAASSERSEKAKALANRRWSGDAARNAPRMRHACDTQCGTHATRNAPRMRHACDTQCATHAARNAPLLSSPLPSLPILSGGGEETPSAATSPQCNGVSVTDALHTTTAAAQEQLEITPETGAQEALDVLHRLRPEYARVSHAAFAAVWKIESDPTVRARAYSEALAALAGRVETDPDPLKLVRGYLRNARRDWGRERAGAGDRLAIGQRVVVQDGEEVTW